MNTPLTTEIGSQLIMLFAALMLVMQLLLVVQRALETSALRRENRRLRVQTLTPDGMIGRSQAAQQLRTLIAKVAPANSRVLISGPPG